MVTVDYQGLPQHRLVPLRKARVDAFTPRQLELTEKIITSHWERTAKEMSGESHNIVGWIVAKDRETIPYEVTHLARGPIPEDAAQYGRSLESIAAELIG